MIRQVLLLLLLCSFCFSFSHSAATSKRNRISLQGTVYYEIESDNFAICFRRLNSTHQVGCSSKHSGSVGIVFYLENQDDIKWLLNHSPQQSYVVVMAAKMFQSDVSDILIGSAKIAGIVIIVENEKDRPDSFSPDVRCPNDRYGLYWSDEQYSSCSKTVWNPYGNGMMFMDIPFPIVIISSSSDVEFILQNCLKKFNGRRDDWDVPKCAMEIRDVMDGAKDTPTCIRRNRLANLLNFGKEKRYCYPMSSHNVFAYLNYVSSTEQLDAGSVIIIAARMDSFSLFTNHFPGYESAALGFVTLHAVAEALGKLRLSPASKIRPVLFALFDGEAFDYIGSSHMVYDIEQKQFLPLTLESIGTFIEVGQVGINNNTDSLWIHTDPISTSRSQDIQNRVSSLASVITSMGTNVGLSVKRTTQGSPLPPASIHQFLKSPKTSIAGVVLTSHEKEFSNRYYNSIFDNPNSTGPETYNDITPTVQRIQKIATIVARTVFSVLVGNTAQINDIYASNVTVANLLYCFTRNPDCELFNSTIVFGEAIKLSEFHSSYLPNFVDVASYVLTYKHKYLLAHFLGSAVDGITMADACHAKSKDNDGYKYNFMNGALNEADGSRKSVCIRSTATVLSALSPAFLISDYDWSSQRYSSWTRSYWSSEAMSVRVFLMPSSRQEIINLCIGCVSFILSLILVHLMHSKSSTLFRQTN